MAITPSGVRDQDMSAEDICIVGFDLEEIDLKTGRKPGTGPEHGSETIQ